MADASFNGMFFGPGHSGTGCLIKVGATTATVVIDGAEVASIALAKAEVSFSGTDDRYLNLKGISAGETVTATTSDRGIIDALRGTGNRSVLDQLDQVAARRRTRAIGRQSVFAVGFLIIGLMVLGAYLAFDPAVQAVTARLPVSFEVELGRSQAAALLEEGMVCADEDLNFAVQEIGRRLVGAMGKTPYAWNVKVMDAKEVNAFALPGGYVFINRALIEKSDSAAEVAGVLAHEFQHVRRRHGMKNVIANIGLRVVLYTLLGDAEAVQGFLLDNMATLAAMQFSREQETEADRLAVELAYRAHIDPKGFLSFMRKLESEAGSVPAGLAILSTHPATGDRMADIEALIEQKGKGTRRPFEADWDAVKTRCTPVRFTQTDSLPE